MKQQSWILLLALLLLLPAMEGQAQKSKKKKKNKTAQSQEKNKANQQIAALYIEATEARITGDAEKAMALYNECLSLDKNNAAVNYELSRLYVDANQPIEALTHSEKASEIAPDNEWYRIMHAETLAMNGNYDDAVAIYEALIKKDPNDFEYYFDISYLHKLNGNYDAAIKSLNQLEAVIGIDESIIFEKQRLFIRQNKIKEAGDELDKLIAMNPNESQYYVKMAEMFVTNNMPEEARLVYARLQKLQPENPQVLLFFAQDLIDEGRIEEYEETLKKIFRNPTMDIASKVQILIGQHEDNNPASIEKSLVYGEILLETHPDDVGLKAIMGDLYYQNGAPLEALQLYRDAVKVNPNEYGVWEQIFFIQSELLDFDGLMKDATAAIEYFPNQPLPYYFQAVGYGRLNEHEKAIESVKRGILISSGNSLLQSEMYSQLGESYHNIKDYENSDKNFVKAIELNPSNATVLNNFSYYLSLRNEKLEEAEKMSKMSNELQPNNSSFLDTYGWILYQKGDYEEAMEYLEKALEFGGADRPVILEHCGDAAFQLGILDKAISYWQQAIDNDGDIETLQDKINNKGF